MQIIKHVPKTVTKKVCTSTKPSGYTPYSDEASYYPPPTYARPSSGYGAPSNSYGAPSNSYGAPTNQKISEPSLGTRYYDGVEDVPHFSYE